MEVNMGNRRIKKVILAIFVILVVGIFNVEFYKWNFQPHSAQEKSRVISTKQRLDKDPQVINKQFPTGQEESLITELSTSHGVTINNRIDNKHDTHEDVHAKTENIHKSTDSARDNRYKSEYVSEMNEEVKADIDTEENINSLNNSSEHEMTKNLGSRGDVFESRWHHVKKVCTAEGRPPPKDLEHSKLSPKMVLELPHNIVYCPVEKVASTFWTKTLTAMNSMGYYSSPYEVRGNKYKVKTYFRHTKIESNLNIELFKIYATSLLVVRDPYSKVFSAYVDKLFNPNVIFWNYMGKPIEKIIANKSTVNQTKLCGHTVTFPDYIKYLIYKFENQESINTHFTPISSHCDPCVTKYDIISKLETFKDDVQAILGHWNKKFNLNIKFQDFEKETAIEIARVHIKLALYTRTETEKRCSIPSYLYLLRTWRFLQISGIIPKQATLPRNWYEETFLQRPEYLMGDILNVLQGNISRPEVKLQRKEAMLQAYKTVSIQDLYKLREIVKADCNYFGYSDMPDEIFNRSMSFPFSNFDYFDSVK